MGLICALIYNHFLEQPSSYYYYYYFNGMEKQVIASRIWGIKGTIVIWTLKDGQVRTYFTFFFFFFLQIPYNSDILIKL